MGKTELAKAIAGATKWELIRLQCYEGLDETKALYEWEYAKQLLYTQLLRDQLQNILSDSKNPSATGMEPNRLNQIRQLLEDNYQVLREQIKQYIGQRIAENLRDMPQDERINRLLNRPFTTLSEKDMLVLREEVRRLATVLKSRVSLSKDR